MAESIEEFEKRAGYRIRPLIPHEWFNDVNYTPDYDSIFISRDLCTCCDAYRYHWLNIKDGKIVEHTFIQLRNTQYSEYGKYAHNCSLIYL